MAKALSKSDAPNVIGLDVRAIILQEAGLSPTTVVDNKQLAQFAQDAALKYYEAGFKTDFEHYPGTVAMPLRMKAGDTEGARGMAKMVQLALDRAGASESGDFWTLATQIEVAMVNGDAEMLIATFPGLLAAGDVGWKLESSLGGMQGLAQMHAGTPLAPLIDAMTSALKTRIAELGEAAKELGAATTDAARAAVATKSDAQVASLTGAFALAAAPFGVGKTVALAKGAQGKKARTEQFLGQSADLRSMTQSQAGGVLIGGNVKWGGQIPDMTITRHTVRVLRTMMDEWGISGATDFNSFNTLVNDKLNDILHLETPDGRRALEDLKSAEHKVLDAFDKGRFELADVGKGVGDSRTDLVALLALGIGDCRPTAFAKQLMFDVWQQDRVKGLMHEALEAGQSGNTEQRETLVGEANKLMKQQLRVVTVEIDAPIQMNGLYDMKLDGQGRPLIDKAGTMNDVENHTFNVLVEFDDDGYLKDEVLSADAFYQHVYPLGDQKLSLSDLMDDGFFDVPHMGIEASNGEKPPFRMAPASYSGSLLRDFEVGSCDVFFAGLPIAPPTAAAFLDQGDEINAIAVGIGQFAPKAAAH